MPILFQVCLFNPGCLATANAQMISAPSSGQGIGLVSRSESWRIHQRISYSCQGWFSGFLNRHHNEKKMIEPSKLRRQIRNAKSWGLQLPLNLSKLFLFSKRWFDELDNCRSRVMARTIASGAGAGRSRRWRWRLMPLLSWTSWVMSFLPPNSKLHIFLRLVNQRFRSRVQSLVKWVWRLEGSQFSLQAAPALHYASKLWCWFRRQKSVSGCLAASAVQW